MALPASTSQNPGYGNGTSMMSNEGTQAYTMSGRNVLDSLVIAGTLTQAQEDAILSSMQSKGVMGNQGPMQGTSMTGNQGSMPRS